MKIVERGVLNRGESGSSRAYSTFPAASLMADGTLLATYRTGSAKDSDDGTIEFRRSHDNGRTWSAPATPLSTSFNDRRGSLWLAYTTLLREQHVLLAALWVDRAAFPWQPLFNSATEGCLPMKILLADSFDNGETWNEWRELAVPEDLGPPSLTNPILRMSLDRLAISIETNKHYYDASPWRQRVVYVYSDDLGQTWSAPETVAEDPSGRIFHWDQRAGVAADGSLVSFAWIYDREAGRYLNIQRRLSFDQGRTWTQPDDLGIADQASHPAIMNDGRTILAWVDRFGTRSIRARLADRIDAPFSQDSEVVLYKHGDNAELNGDTTAESTGKLLEDMGTWSYGLPFATVGGDGAVLVFYYAPHGAATQILWNRLEP